MLPLALIGQGASMLGGLTSSLSRLFLARKQRKMADAINPVRTYYQTSPYALENKQLAQNQMNGRMPGAAAAQQGIQTAQAGVINAANRNATSSADALAIAAGSQGTANQATANLATQEAQYANNAVNNVMAANNALTQENDKVYQDKLMDYNQMMATKNALLGASMSNQGAAWNGVGAGLMMGGNALMTAKNASGNPFQWGDALSGMNWNLSDGY